MSIIWLVVLTFPIVVAILVVLIVEREKMFNNVHKRVIKKGLGMRA
jgi:hypothetical protein